MNPKPIATAATPLPPFLVSRDAQMLLYLRVQPRASRDKIAGRFGERLKICITAPPVDGAANEHLLCFIARHCKVARREVALLQGNSSRDKTIALPVTADFSALLAFA